MVYRILKLAKANTKAVAPEAALRLYRKAWITRRVRRLGGTRDDWVMLKQLSRRITHPGHASRFGDPRNYGELLALADPGLELPDLETPEFIGRGRGAENLNCYRCGTLDGQLVFEKTYLVDSDSWQKLMWLHKEVLPGCPGTIRTPPLLRHVRGDWLLTAYFSFLSDARPMPQDHILESAIDFQNKVRGFRWAGTDPIICDFRREFMYADGSAQLRRLLEAKDRDADLVERIEAWLLRAEMPRCFTHADFNPVNVLASGEVFDLDRCGYYPAGYELGGVLGKFYHFENVPEFESFLQDKLGDISHDVRAATLYFSALFYTRGIGVKVPEPFILSLFDRAWEFIEQQEATVEDTLFNPA